MTDLVSKTVRLPPALWEQLAARAERTDRSVNYEIIQAVQGHVVKVVPDVGKLVSGQYQSGTKVVPERCTPDQDTPAPADAPVHDDMKKKEDLGVGSPELRIAELLEQLPWFGAKLAKSSSPAKFATQLFGAFPGLPIEPELHKASAWLENNPQKRKSKLGSFLLSWMGNHGKGPQQGLFSGAPKESTAQVQARQQDYTPPKGWK